MRKESESISQAMDTIECMLRQELSYQPPTMEEDPTSDRFSRVGIESRGRMLTFFYDLLDKIGSSRETAEVAISHLDRFLASPIVGPQTLRNKKMFQLASTTSLYMAVKMMELQAITPSLLADLSHGIFTASEVEDMELFMAQTLRWRLNPPTTLAFVRQYLELIPCGSNMTRDMKRMTYDLARHQTEAALADPRLFCEKKSLVAYAAVENALQKLHIYNVDLCDTAGAMVLAAAASSSTTTQQQVAVYHRYANLQSILYVSLTSKLCGGTPPPQPMVAVQQPPAPASPPTSSSPNKFFSSWFLPSSSATKTSSPYRVSPRSVNNANVA